MKSTPKREVFEWIIVGYLLGHPDREKEIEKIPPSFLSAERRSLVDSMRPGNKGRELFSWMESKGSPIEKGSTAIETIIAAITDMNRREKIRRVVDKIRVLNFDTDDDSVLENHLRECLTLVEQSSE